MQFFSRTAHNCPIRYDSTQKRLRQSKYNRVDFCPLTYNGEVAKRPDLRSPISKIRDIHFVGTDDLIIFRKFHNFP